MAEPETEKKTSSVVLDCSLLEDFVSKLQLSPSPSAKMATKEHTLSMPDWSLLPDDLLQVISEKLENCFDVVHARSVCSAWRSTFPFPACLLRPSYSLPSFAELPYESEDLCTLEKIPLFLFRVRTLDDAASGSEFFVGAIDRRDESEDHTELPPPLQCSVKIPGSSDSEPTLVNMLDCQILSLGYDYRMFEWEPEGYIRMAVLPLNKDEFVVLLYYSHVLLVLTSAEMKWKRLENVLNGSSMWHLVAFRGKFYASLPGEVLVIDPYSLDVTLTIPSSLPLEIVSCLVPSGNDELFQVKVIASPTGEVYLGQAILRVSKLDEEAGKWVVVTDIGDRVLLIHGEIENVFFSAKELPDGCGLSRNSILITDEPRGESFLYKYGVDTGNAEDDLSFWRSSRDTCVRNISSSPMAYHLRVEQNLTLET